MLLIVTFVCDHGMGGLGQAEADRQSSLTLVISAVHSESYVGAPIDIVVRIVNESDHDLEYLQRQPDLMVGWDVKDEAGHPAKLTAFGVKMTEDRDTVAHSAMPVRLRPGQQAVYMVRVNAQIDLSMPGRYTLRASYHSIAPPPRQVQMKPSGAIRIVVKDINFPEQGKIGAADLRPNS